MQKKINTTMLRLLIFVALAIPLFLSAQRIPDGKFEELCFGKDTEGKDIMCHFVPCEGSKQILLAHNHDSLLISDDKGSRLLDLNSFELKASFKNKTDDQTILLTKNGYLGAKPGVWTPRVAFYDFNGNLVWKVKKLLSILEFDDSVVVCFAKRGPGNVLTGYDLASGQELWNTTIKMTRHDYRCHHLSTHVGSSQKKYSYLIGDSLYRLDGRTGATISRPFRAGIKNAPLSNRFKFTEPEIFPSKDFMIERHLAPDKYTLTGLHSNWIQRGDSLIIADADTLYCLNPDLVPIWETALPENMGSKSCIELSGNRIIMLNYGVAFTSLHKHKYGKPFVAAYDIESGKQLNVSFPDIKNEINGGLYTESGTIYWMTKNDFYSVKDDDNATTKIKWKRRTSFQPDDYAPDLVLCDTVYTIDQDYLRPIATDENQLVAEIYGKDVNIINLDGTCCLIPHDQVYFRDSRNVYSTNEDHKEKRHFIIADPYTKKIKSRFFLRGKIFEMRNHIIINTPQGVGIINE